MCVCVHQKCYRETESWKQEEEQEKKYTNQKHGLCILHGVLVLWEGKSNNQLSEISRH